MVDIRNIKELEKIINTKLKEVMSNEVLNETKKAIQEHVEQDVYKAYSPIVYKRTLELKNPDNMIPTITETSNEVELEVENIAHGDERDVVRVVETGVGYYGNLDSVIGARPFMTLTQEDMEKGRFEKSLKKGLENRGIKVV